MDERSKQRQRERAVRGLDERVDDEERRRRKAEATRKRSARRARGPRRRSWDADDVDADAFEKIQRSRAPRVRGAGRSPADLAALPRAVVAALDRGRVVLDDGASARLAGHLAADPSFELAVGDEVALAATDGPPRIEARLARRTCLSRPDPGHPSRTLVLAANVDVAVVVAAAKAPPLRPGLIDRLLLAIAHGGARAVICVNKLDLLRDQGERAAIDTALAPYAGLGHPVALCSATTGEGIAALGRALSGRTCVFVGHSGVGKSSILNAIDPGGERATGDVRPHDGKGRHTTTRSCLRVLGDGTRVIDTPGVRGFGLGRIDAAELRAGFPELTSFAGGCRFGNCTHAHEPECAVRAAAAAGRLPAERYASYLRILAEP